VNSFDRHPERDDIAADSDPAYVPDSAHVPDPADTSHSAHATHTGDIQEERTSTFPWPPGDSDTVVDAWARTWQGASLTPRSFFSLMPREGSLGAAVLYYLSIGIAVAGAQLFWSMAGGADDMPMATTVGATDAIAPWSPLIEFLTAPVILLLSLFIAAGATHLLLKVLGGTQRGDGSYGTTARVFAYAYSPNILGIIPVIGVVAGFVWMVVVAIVGVREAHRTTTGRASAAVLVPLTIGLAFVALAELIVRLGGLLELPV
jgi:hypothetical protein